MAGDVWVCAVLSLALTVKVQSAELFPLASVAWQVTVVVPFGKVEPLGGVQVVVEPGQLSPAVVVRSEERGVGKEGGGGGGRWAGQGNVGVWLWAPCAG